MKKIITLSILLITIISCSKDSSEEDIILNDENIISSFKLNINGNFINGSIDEINKEITFSTRGANLNSLTPVINFSNSATINPSPNIPQDFSDPINYSVTAENGDLNIYKVTVTNTPLSSEKKITKFSTMVNGQEIQGNIDNDTKIISLNVGNVNLKSIVPLIEISNLATISYQIGSPQNFENEITYKVTAEDGSNIDYIIRVNWPLFIDTGFGNINTSFFITAKFSIIGENLNTNYGGELYFSDGINNYDLNIIDTSVYQQGTSKYRYHFMFQSDIKTSVYKIFYKRGDLIIEHAFDFDIKQENVPAVNSTNQTSYNFNDTMIINGENLTSSLIIPSNGSQYIINSSGSYFNYNLSSDKKQIKFDLNLFELFPSYYGDQPRTKSIMLIGEGFRKGPIFNVIFN